MDISALRKESLKKCVNIIESIINQENGYNIQNNLEMVKFRIKSEESIKAKMRKQNINIDKVYDLIGIRFIFKTTDQCYDFLERIKTNKDFKINEIRDYIKSPKDLDEYKAIHVLIGYGKYLCEIQIMNIDMNKLDENTHDDYKKGLLNIV